MAVGTDLLTRFRNAFSAAGLVVRGSADAEDSTAPTVTSGAGAPSASEPNGSIYLRTDGAVATTFYERASGAWVAIVGTDVEIAALAGLTSAADKVPYFTGSGTADVATFTAFGRSLVDDADATAGRATLGAASSAETAAIVAENTDVVIPIDLSNRIDVSGTWTLSRTGAGIYRLRRTAAAAVEASALRVQPRERTSASKGFKVSGFVMKYAITTADPVDVTVDGVFTPMPATGAAVAAATSLGAVTYDAAHDTAAERKAVGEHTMTGTFATPVYLNGKDEVEILVTVDSTGLATPVIDVYKLVLTGSETLVELA